MNILLLSKFTLRDLIGHTEKFESLEEHIQTAMDWLCFAQDVQNDGGLSLRYSLLKGWAPSYPETTGYIIPTFIEYASLTKKEEYLKRALKMAEWEMSIQQEDGSFKGWPLVSKNGSLIFDTGQIILGLIEAYRMTGKSIYLEKARNAGSWLVENQDNSGIWRKHTYHSIPHSYHTRVAWALAELEQYTKDRIYSEASSRNIEWALSKQKDNGWFDLAGFTEQDHATPYTHTIAYTIRGILEVGVCLNNDAYINASIRSANALVKIIRPDGSYGATYDSNWESKDNYTCLTGNGQIAIILFKLYKICGEKKFLETAKSIDRFLCKCQKLEGPPEVRGAIAGSYPIWGNYERFAFPNWATKFFVDALMMERKLNMS